MCGDFDDQTTIDQELFERFLEGARRFGVTSDENATGALHLDTEQVRADYMDALFRAGLTRSLNDASRLPVGERMDALAGQAIVFARLAGFLTAQFPPEADLFRAVTSAVVHGHDDPQHSH